MMTTPFPGLRAFEEHEEHLFFGRERQVDELLQKLSDHRFLAVIGTSGSGKSSLVKSGLLPALFRGFLAGAGSTWKIALLRPGSDPIGNLAAAISAAGTLSEEEDPEGIRRSIAETVLRRSKLGLSEAVQQLSSGPGNVLIVVDQFEELFRYSRYEKETHKSERDALAFVSLLLEAAAQSAAPIYVTITMRSDFLGHCTEFRGLPEAINKGLYLIPRMTREEIRAAITGPVAVGGATIAPVLVTRLLNDVGDSPDQLPILQHALMRTWQRWSRDAKDGEPIGLAHYEATGTMKNALSQHAEEAYAELGTERLREVCELMFRSLTEKPPDTPGTRRPSKFSELCAITGAAGSEMRQVIDVFRAPGRSFLMPPHTAPLGPDTIIDISHESLMRVWERLANWVEEEAESAEIYLNLVKAAKLHDEGKAGLYKSPELELAVRWRGQNKPNAAWGAKFNDGFERAMHFLEKSEEHRQRELLQEVQKKQRKRKRFVALSVFLVLGLCLLSAGVTYIIDQNSRQAVIDITNQIENVRARSFKSLHISNSSESPERMLLAAEIALEAHEELDRLYEDLYGEQHSQVDAVNFMALDRVFWNQPEAYLYAPEGDTFLAAAVMHKSNRAVLATRDTVYETEMNYPKGIRRKKFAAGVGSGLLCFSPDDRYMAASDNEGRSLVLFLPDSGYRVKRILSAEPFSKPSELIGACFPDPETVLLARSEKEGVRLELFDVSMRRPVKEFSIAHPGFTAAALRSHTIALAVKDSILVYSARNNTLQRTMQISAANLDERTGLDSVMAMAISPDLDWLAWSDKKGNIGIISLKAEEGTKRSRAMTRAEHEKYATSLHFFKLGSRLFLASGSFDGQAAAVDVYDAMKPVPQKEPLFINSEPGQADMLCGSSDGRILLIRNPDLVCMHITSLPLLVEQVKLIHDSLKKILNAGKPRKAS